MEMDCPWKLETLSWRGHNSHNPLREMVSGDFDLSDEQLEMIAAQIKEKNRL